jgi:hypothetical protein
MEYGMNCVTVVQYRANHRNRGDEISGVSKKKKMKIRVLRDVYAVSLVTTYQCTWRIIPEDTRLHQHRLENRISRKTKLSPSSA